MPICPHCGAVMHPASYNDDDFNSNREDFSYGQQEPVCDNPACVKAPVTLVPKPVWSARSA